MSIQHTLPGFKPMTLKLKKFVLLSEPAQKCENNAILSKTLLPN